MLVFDVNETLLEIDSLEPLFSRRFGDRKMSREWFAQLVLYSQAVTLAGLYATYTEIGAGALFMLGEIHNVAIGNPDVEELKARIHDLPAHSEVPVTLLSPVKSGAVPRSSVSSTGASSHILIRRSIAPSTTRRATDLEIWKSIKVAVEIRVNDFSMASVDQPMKVCYCVQCAAVSPIGVLLWR